MRTSPECSRPSAARNARTVKSKSKSVSARVTAMGALARYAAMASCSASPTWASTSSHASARPATAPAAAAASMPFSPPVCGTTTLLAFFTMLPLTSSSMRSGSPPARSRARAAARAMAMGSVQPIAGMSSSSRVAM